MMPPEATTSSKTVSITVNELDEAEVTVNIFGTPVVPLSVVPETTTWSAAARSVEKFVSFEPIVWVIVQPSAVKVIAPDQYPNDGGG